VGKYRQLDLEYGLEGDHAMSEEGLARIGEIMKRFGITCNIIRH
jgi:hypothetical protein